MWKVGRASDEEGLRMMLAFFNIADPRQRLRLIELAEAFARGAPLASGESALTLQDNAQPDTPHHDKSQHEQTQPDPAKR
ncbi:MAG: hypothetical protein JWR49_409 [Tardiphaga sp.]|nr:hypothetical protein [Tardiphaga sp.]